MIAIIVLNWHILELLGQNSGYQYIGSSFRQTISIHDIWLLNRK